MLERAGWKCQNCQRGTETLHVHHLVYESSEPWEADLKDLECLCEDCHDWREEFNKFWGRGAIPTSICVRFDRLFRPFFNGHAGRWRVRSEWNGLRVFQVEFSGFIGVIERKFDPPTDGSDYSI